MKKYLKRNLMAALLTVLSFNMLGCNKDNNRDVSDIVTTPITENTETINLEETKSDTNTDSELVYNSAKTLIENIDNLNTILESKYGKSLTISTIEEYEKTDRSDWVLVLEDNRVGIDTSTWKFDYDSNSDDSKYMDAILSTFIFFCGEEMGNSLWLLTGDLLDGGADETLYGFEHDGGQTIYKNGNIAAYEPGGSKGTIFLWLTPSKY
jgi:hypothetical protein